MANRTNRPPLSYSGYHQNQELEPDFFLCQVGPGTPGGEYHRRYWQPVAYTRELTDVPLKVRALGEDLVVFRTGSGEVAVLHLHCCHRNTSLEFGLIEEYGIRCCYHGRLFGVDGTILDVPGEPAAEQIKKNVSQGAYPTHVFADIVFVYMGPPDRIPVFPTYDRLQLPGVQLIPGNRWELPCNWLQIKENPVDPLHTSVLHVIPQMRGMDHFADDFSNFPELYWEDIPAGIVYLAVRRVGDNVWVRSAEVQGDNFHCISSIFENGQQQKKSSYPFLSFWTLPVDDEHSITFPVSHVQENEAMCFEKRRELEDFGQTGNRSYRDRQWLPSDYEAQTSQGAINVHAKENLGAQDRGVVMYRRLVRSGIEAVQRGEDPYGFYMEQEEVPSTFANDWVAPISDLKGDPENPEVLRNYARRIAQEYKQNPPMASLMSRNKI